MWCWLLLITEAIHTQLHTLAVAGHTYTYHYITVMLASWTHAHHVLCYAISIQQQFINLLWDSLDGQIYILTHRNVYCHMSVQAQEHNGMHTCLEKEFPLWVQLVSIGTLQMLLQLLLVVGFNSLDGVKYASVCVCVCTQAGLWVCRCGRCACGKYISACMHACAHVGCHHLYMCDIHLSHVQLPLCLLQLRGLLLSLVLHLHQEVILVVFVELQM